MRSNFRRRRKKKLNTKQIFLIIILLLFTISISYATYTTQLTINGTATGVQEQLSVLYIDMGNSSSFPDTIGYMDTYSYTFAIPPVIQSIRMGGVTLVANTDYTYSSGTLTIPNVTDDLIIQGDDEAESVNVTFNIDGNENIVTVSQGQTVNKPQDPVKSGYGFLGWADSNDVYFDFSTPIMADITLYAKWRQDAVAEISGTYYNSLQLAINAVPKNDTETTIKLLTNTTEDVVIDANQNIVFNLQTFTVKNDKNEATFTNNGTIKIYNGNIQAEGKYSCINNNSTGMLYVTGGRIRSIAGERAAIFNEGGRVEISGDAYLSSTANGAYNHLDRGTVQNYPGGNVTIKSGTIICTGPIAVSNAGTLTIGEQGGTPSKTSPEIIGKTYGVKTSTNISYYDGIVKGITDAFNDETKITAKETGYIIVHSTETIDNSTYKTAYLAANSVVMVEVTFDANGGQVSEGTRNVEQGTKVGNLPTPTRTDYAFKGWYTLAEGGDEVTKDTIINNSIRFYAHWEDVKVAEISGTKYATIKAAVNAVPTDNTETTIKILKNVEISERITINANKKIVLNIQNFTISNGGDFPIIENFGTLSISNGTITSSATQGAINNKSGGKLYVSGGSIIATGTRQAIYNDGGTTYISGTAVLRSSTNERATVQNHSGTVNITGGTIISTGFSAVLNESGKTCNIGTKDGNIDTTSPVIQGTEYGINNSGTLKFYDGDIKGITDAINGTVSDKETNSQIVNGTEVISGTTYKTAHLELTQ